MSTSDLPRPFGLLNVDKPAGPTSHDVVARIRRRLPRRTRLGHAGTLDPFATGVLVLCAGPATRLAPYVQQATKRYRAVVMLGATSTTDDPEGEVVPHPRPAAPSEDELRAAAARFVGRIAQTPPAHSAVHVNGRRAYRLARRGEAPALQPRPVMIHAIEIVRYDWPEAELDVRCGAGTYIRALARDLGAALGTGGYCARLRRTAVGAFLAADAVTPEALDPWRDLRDPLEAVAHLPRFEAGPDHLERLAMGQRVEAGEVRGVSSEEPHGVRSVGVGEGDVKSGAEVAVVDARGALVAIAQRAEGDLLQPVKVFVSLSEGT